MTGSATPNHKGIMHSGTGRIAKLAMRTMSLYETQDSSGKISLMSLFEDEIKPTLTGDVELKKLIYYCIRGGLPANTDISLPICGEIAKEYLKTVVADDMFQVDGVKRDSRKVWLLLHSLGRNESTVVSMAVIRKDISAMDGEQIDSNTISDYLSVLNRLFIIVDQPAFNTKLRSSRRILKSPKRHFSNPSLAVAALGATETMILNDLNTFGFIFEALCEHDLKIYAEYNGAQMFHLRDEKGNEADAIVEFPDGTWGAFEIKLGTNQIDAAAKELLKLKAFLKKKEIILPKYCVSYVG